MRLGKERGGEADCCPSTAGFERIKAKGLTPICTDSTDDGRRERGGRKGCAKYATGTLVKSLIGVRFKSVLIRGNSWSIISAAHDETVSCCGRNDIFFNW